jgi:NAD(P)-dependent dehydrogenase (short-subunit alcohol dehydrogenase family)
MSTELIDSGLRRLAGRRVLVTGAASGIGRATAELFAAEGSALILLDRNAEGLAEIAATTGASAFEADVTDERAVADAVDQGASAMGGIDGVVNVAGVHCGGSVAEVSVAEFRKVVEVNLIGVYSVVRSCLPWLRQTHPATVVNIGSAQALLPNSAERTAYAASKGGVVNLSRALAAELAPAIRVNSVCPGLVATPMAQGFEARASAHALKRLAEPSEIAYAVLFLTSSESSYMTGSALAVDGGRTFH